MTIVRHKHVYRNGPQTRNLLAQLGIIVPVKKWRALTREGFEWLLDDARAQYQKRRIELQPRLEGDDEMKVKDLNSIWLVIERRLENLINPQLLPVASQIEKPYVQHLCRLASCSKTFIGPKSRLFCCREHRKTHYEESGYNLNRRKNWYRLNRETKLAKNREYYRNRKQENTVEAKPGVV